MKVLTTKTFALTAISVLWHNTYCDCDRKSILTLWVRISKGPIRIDLDPMGICSNLGLNKILVSKYEMTIPRNHDNQREKKDRFHPNSIHQRCIWQQRMIWSTVSKISIGKRSKGYDRCNDWMNEWMNETTRTIGLPNISTWEIFIYFIWSYLYY